MASKSKVKNDEIKYSTLAEDWVTPDGLMLLECWARDGYTYKDVANRIGIEYRTLIRWRDKYPKIDEALRMGREIIDYKVENALLKSALGYRTRESKVIVELNNATGELETTKRETITKDVQPSVKACEIWLCNRLPDKWKKNRDNIIEIDEEDSTIQVSVVRASKRPSEDENDKQSSKANIWNDEESDDEQDEVNDTISIKRNNEYYEKKAKGKKKTSKASNTRNKDCHSIKDTSDEIDLDYWPDDWEG